MSRIKVDRITDKAGTGAPILVNGMNVTGKSTMGDVVGAAATFNSITAGGDATFSSNVSTSNLDVTGISTFRSDLRLSDSIVHLDNSSTKIRFPSSDTISAETAGTERVVIKSDGKIGLGLNNPGLKLHIQDGALPSAPAPNGNCDVVLEGTTNTGIQFLSGTQTQLRFGDADSTAAGSIIYKHTDDNFRLNFSNSGHLSIWDGGGENLRFTPNNEIGIAGANYGTSGQVLTSGGAGAAVQWATPAGGAWEVLSTTDFATSPANDSTNRGWTTNYQAVKLIFSFLRQTSANSDCAIQFFMNEGYGSNGTLVTDNEYKYAYTFKTWNASSLSNANQESTRWRLASGGGGQWWSGEITFKIGTAVPSYNTAKAAWGWVERDSGFGMDSCKFDGGNETNDVIVGAKIYRDGGGNFTEGRATWYGIKYS